MDARFWYGGTIIDGLGIHLMYHRDICWISMVLWFWYGNTIGNRDGVEQWFPLRYMMNLSGLASLTCRYHQEHTRN
jgi:hypothetical protein